MSEPTRYELRALTDDELAEHQPCRYVCGAECELRITITAHLYKEGTRVISADVCRRHGVEEMQTFWIPRATNQAFAVPLS